MLNEQFWNKGEGNECLDKISGFIKNFPICRNFNDVQKKQLEEGIYDLIYSVKEPVFRKCFNRRTFAVAFFGMPLRRRGIIFKNKSLRQSSIKSNMNKEHPDDFKQTRRNLQV